MLVIIIGLPCSGKTTLTQNEYNDYIIYDDFITNFFDGKLLNDIIDKKNVCINDPRLCNIKIFNRYINMFIEYLTKDDIKLILFENDKEKCIKNMEQRNDNRNVLNTINFYSDIYNVSNYQEYNCEIKKIWQLFK